MPPATYLQIILHCFTAMDIDGLRLYLKDEYTYENTNKEIFLNEIETIFNSHLNSGDTKLLLFPGACVSRTCPNCGNSGYRFVGNHSKNYFDLIFEIQNDDIIDIYACSEFESQTEVARLGTRAEIFINPDDATDFPKTPEYWAKVYASEEACNELGTTSVYEIDVEELRYWLKKHEELYKRLGGFDPFVPPMKWTPFLMLYFDAETRTAKLNINP